MPRRRAIAPNIGAERRRRRLAAQSRARVLEQQHCGIERQRTRRARTRSTRRAVQLARLASPTSSPRARPRAPALRRAARTSSGGGSISQRERHRQVLDDRQRLEQHGALADDAEAIDESRASRRCRRSRASGGRTDCTSPVSGSVAPVTRLTNISAAGWSRPRIATCSPAATRSSRDPQRPEAAVVLRNAGELEDRRHDRAEMTWRLTSSTMRLDAVRASISILAAARLQAIAP